MLYSAHFWAKPTDKIRVLEAERLDAIAEVNQIKSIQLEFVKHSL